MNTFRFFKVELRDTVLSCSGLLTLMMMMAQFMPAKAQAMNLEKSRWTFSQISNEIRADQASSVGSFPAKAFIFSKDENRIVFRILFKSEKARIEFRDALDRSYSRPANTMNWLFRDTSDKEFAYGIALTTFETMEKEFLRFFHVFAKLAGLSKPEEDKVISELRSSPTVNSSSAGFYSPGHRRQESDAKSDSEVGDKRSNFEKYVKRLGFNNNLPTTESIAWTKVSDDLFAGSKDYSFAEEWFGQQYVLAPAPQTNSYFSVILANGADPTILLTTLKFPDETSFERFKADLSKARNLSKYIRKFQDVTFDKKSMSSSWTLEFETEAISIQDLKTVLSLLNLWTDFHKIKYEHAQQVLTTLIGNRFPNFFKKALSGVPGTGISKDSKVAGLDLAGLESRMKPNNWRIQLADRRGIVLRNAVFQPKRPQHISLTSEKLGSFRKFTITTTLFRHCEDLPNNEIEELRKQFLKACPRFEVPTPTIETKKLDELTVGNNKTRVRFTSSGSAEGRKELALALESLIEFNGVPDNISELLRNWIERKVKDTSEDEQKSETLEIDKDNGLLATFTSNSSGHLAVKFHWNRNSEVTSGNTFQWEIAHNKMKLLVQWADMAGFKEAETAFGFKNVCTCVNHSNKGCGLKLEDVDVGTVGRGLRFWAKQNKVSTALLWRVLTVAQNTYSGGNTPLCDGNPSLDRPINEAIKEVLEMCTHCQDRSGSLKNCARCLNVKYCSVDCQVADWPDHKNMCKRAGRTAGSSSAVTESSEDGDTACGIDLETPTESVEAVNLDKGDSKQSVSTDAEEILEVD